ncbi:MAG TPA: YfhO family protein, partial [Clostridia bacterium]|nr:YfhO family protein [Clostridia bacterium]
MNKNLKKNYVYLLIFLIPVLILVLVYAVRKVYPFGSNSVLVLDLNAQYIYYYEAFRDAVLGDKSLLYSFGRTLGGEFVGIYAYYLASPFSLILLIFPR